MSHSWGVGRTIARAMSFGSIGSNDFVKVGLYLKKKRKKNEIPYANPMEMTPSFPRLTYESSQDMYINYIP